MSKKENNKLLKSSILSLVTERGCVYESELIKELTESDNEAEHRTLLTKVIELSWEGKLSIVKDDGVSMLRATSGVYH